MSEILAELFGCSIIRSVGSFSLLPAEPAGCHFHVPGGSCDLWRAFALFPSRDGKEYLVHFMQFFNQKLEKSCAESPYLIIQPHSGFLFVLGCGVHQNPEALFSACMFDLFVQAVNVIQDRQRPVCSATDLFFKFLC